MTRAADALDRYARLLDAEREAELEEHRTLVATRGLEAFVDAGRALAGLTTEDEGSGLGGRFLVTYGPKRPATRLSDSRLRVGDVVRVVRPSGDLAEGPTGLVSARTQARITVAFEEAPDGATGHAVALVQAPDDVTWRRQKAALAALGRARLGRVAELRDLLLDDDARLPAFEDQEAPGFLDAGLDESQRRAVARALAAEDLALVHGPPGTGKTTTLVEIVRQARRRGERILVTAASNTAVDNLVERLVALGEPVVRVGHPARVDPALHDTTLDFRVRSDDAFKLSRRRLDEARDLMQRRGKVGQKVARGRLRLADARLEKRALSKEIGALMDDVHRLEREAVARVLGRADIVCATLTSAAGGEVAREIFDLAVVDEATQATAPATLLAVGRLGELGRLVLAGDPCQLPPTVKSADAVRGGLEESLFETMVRRHGDGVCTRLSVQYRMHREIMGFSSARFYDGSLEAHASVADHRLTGLEGIAGEGIEAPLLFIDTAGKGFDEVRPEGSESCANPGEAALAADRVRALLAAGLDPAKVAIITPYAAQVRVLRGLLEDVDGLEIDTVDGFQGREKEAVVVSLVRSNPDGEVGFLGEIRRMNVAWTRARRRLEVVGDSATLGSHPFYAAMVGYVEERGQYLSAWELAPGSAAHRSGARPAGRE